MDKIWNELLAFETLDLVKRYMKNKKGKDLTTERARQITSNFIQGREYFKSAQESSITVRPLLQYYAIMSLSKGLILSLDTSISEHQLKSSHGLEIKNWPQVLKNKDFENLEISVGQGTFSELLVATQNINYLSVNTSAINWKSHLSPPTKGYVFHFKDVMQYFPDLDKEYNNWLESDLNYAIIDEFKYIGDGKEKLHIKVRKECNDELIELLFPSKYCRNREVKGHKNYTTITYLYENWNPNITQCWKFALGDIGDACIVPVIAEDKGLNLLCGMYMISYVFGMMARYYPTTWMSLMRVEKGDKIYPFIHRILDYIYEKYPKQIMIFLNAPYDFEKQ